MVGRFNVHAGGAGAEDWSVWDNASNGDRGTGLSEVAVRKQTR